MHKVRKGHYTQVWIRVARPLNNRMLVRALIIYITLTSIAVAFHEHTFAVWELRELLMERQLNLWELLEQLKYVTDEQRAVVYVEIEHMKSEIMAIVDQLLQHDRSQHP